MMPQDLTTDSSTLKRTGDAETKQALESIHEKRNTVAIVRANIGLMSDLIKAATDYRKVEGLVIDYRTVEIDNETKMVKQEISRVRLDKEGVRLQGEKHLMDQETVKTTAIGEMTALVSEEWEQRKALARAKVDALKQSAEKMLNTYQETRAALDI